MKRAIVIGGSIGGLLAANVLVRAGWHVEVYERANAGLTQHAMGVIVHPELQDAFDRIGLRIDNTLGISAPSRMVLNRAGEVIGEFARTDLVVAWDVLYGMLVRAFPKSRMYFGKHLVKVIQHNEKAVAVFVDGSSAEAHIIIGADGIRSTVRAQFQPKVKPHYAGYVAWRGRIDERDVSAEARDHLFDHLAFCLPPREQILGYPIAGLDNSLVPGERRYNFAWYRPADEQELKRLSTDELGRCHDDGNPITRARRQILAEVRHAAFKNLAPQFAEVVTRARQLCLQPIYDVMLNDMVFGRAVLLGDSAFAPRPHCGMAITKAAGDAVALGDLLNAHDLATALERYNASRVALGRQIVVHSQHLSTYLQGQLDAGVDPQIAQRHSTPEAVMKETAVPPDTGFF